MFFVPSRDGVSHAPEEHTDATDLWAGYAFVREYARRMQSAPERV
jgi:acetylornithine deacetylase/succinyl-diaminopimelate desuccinylase-like protein